ncbi:MAG: glycosyltransferase [Proteobacteria bacterium]|nr:glycosyltransferase [Desulfobacula sp.]MBU3952347.1 glycosyltransferase [Pseudomonadota bacterium]MBU4132225.1 glycosyltransferase [Pseudomonadota bacterium]
MRPRLAYIVHSLNPGGTERLAIDMAKYFSKAYDMVILCLDEPGKWASDAQKSGIPVYSFDRRPGIDWKIPVKLRTFAKKHQIDLFHAHQYTPWFYAALTRMIHPRVKVLFQEHGRHYPETKKTKRKWINQHIFQHLTAECTAVSGDIKQRLIFYEGLLPEKIKIIYNGVKPIAPIGFQEKEDLRSQLGFRPTDVVVGTCGRLDPIKNMSLFLDGFELLKPNAPHLKALIVGDGPLMPVIKDRVAQSGFEKDIVLTGFRTDATLFVQTMDIFTLTSFSEGTSMALLEAMACAIPAIVSDVGGNPELIENQKTGWVVPSNDLDGFRAALADAVNTPDKRRNMGRDAKKKFETHFSFNTMIQAYEKVYETLLGRP